MPYFDHCATAPPNEEIYSNYIKNLNHYWYNPAAIYPEGMEAAKLIRETRRKLARRFGTHEHAWIQTSGATESVVTAIKGTLRQRGGKRSVTIAFEGDHDATNSTLKNIKHYDWPVTILPLTGEGHPDLEALEQELVRNLEAGEHVRLITVLYVNNETGAIADIEGVRDLRRRYARDALVHLDMVQAPGRVPVDFGKLDPDLASFSGHKLGAPRGVGFLYIKHGVTVLPLMRGGGQQGGLRGGTENAPLFVAMCEALLKAVDDTADASKHVRRLRELMLNELNVADVPYVLNTPACGSGTGEGHTPAILSVAFPGLRGETLLHLMEREGFQVSTSSACTSRADDSHVLIAMGVPQKHRQGTLRISFALSNTEEEAIQLGKELAKQVQWLRTVMG